MRLLDKKTINKEVAAQTKRQIDSGIAISKKVDAIRATLQEETEQLEKFRSESIKRVQEEIDSKVRERDTIHEEVKRLEVKRLALLEPLDSEWERIGKEKERLTQADISLKQKAADIGKRENLVQAGETELVVEANRALDLTKRATEKLELTEQYRNEARELLAAARIQAEDIFSEAKKKQREVHSRELGVSAWEAELSKREEAVRLEKEDLVRREIVLKDRYATLERTINRMK